MTPDTTKHTSTAAAAGREERSGALALAFLNGVHADGWTKEFHVRSEVAIADMRALIEDRRTAVARCAALEQSLRDTEAERDALKGNLDASREATARLVADLDAALHNALLALHTCPRCRADLRPVAFAADVWVCADCRETWHVEGGAK